MRVKYSGHLTFRLAMLRALLGFAVLGTFCASAQEKITYQDHVLPLIENHCAKCHNPDKKKGDLDLTSYNGTMKGGGSGPAVVSGNPDSSKLWRSVMQVEDPTMPPNKSRLPDKELDVFKKWILGGLLETSGSKAIAASKSTVDLTLKAGAIGKPEGPPPMPKDLSVEPVVHTTHLNPVTALATSPWAPLFAIAGQKQILVYDSDKLDLLGILPFSVEGQPADLKFSRNGKLLLAGGGRGGKSGRVLVWEITTGERLMTIGEEYDTVLAADISPDQGKVALGGPTRLVKIYSTKSGEMLHKMKKHTDWVTALAFSPNGEMLATADRNGGIVVWDPENGQEVLNLTGHKSGITALSWRADSKFIASSSEDGTVKVWETQDGKAIKTINAHTGGALWVSYSQDGKLVSCGRDNSVTAWDGNGTKVKSFTFPGEIALRAVFNLDATRVAATDFAGHVAVWSVKDGKQLGELDPNPLPLAEQISLAEKKVTELQSKGDKPDPEAAAAEAALAKATAALDASKKAADEAKAAQTAREAEVAKLKAAAAAIPPPAGIMDKMVPAREARLKARTASTNALQLVQTRTKELAQAKAKVEKLNAVDKTKLLAEAQAQLKKLKAAQAQASLFKVRESLTAKKRERERMLALLSEKEEALKTENKNLASNSDSATKTKAKEELKKLSGEMKDVQAAMKKLEREIASEQSRYEKVAAEYERVKTASADPAAQQSKS
ncbi:MAG: domain, G-beta repeat [Verrucomicrobiales bacterium]|nr:domain, G-beta repeat [Verrucomicrobiales bacterium]